ncbi:MAG TPA: ketoacyl-ACP synthase III, partial [Acidimicrobiia bacterium]|nr:ketoacyl-ACP synthase III [Acidimicrobiia bacterium]
MGIGIVGVGHQLSGREETNEELCALLPDTTPEWIVEKTGITRRYLATEDETASGMAIAAARRALEMAGIGGQDVGLIIACTFSADYAFPPVSAKIQHELGAKGAQIFDLQANCAGFVSGLTVASDRMRADPEVRYAVVVGVELHTRFIDRTDVDTAIYFSDGAGAAVLGHVPDDAGILASAFFTDASNYESVRLRLGGSTYAGANGELPEDAKHIEQSGLATWKQAVTHLPITVRRALEKSDVDLADVDLFLFHQANLNLLQYVIRKLRHPPEHTYTNVERIGNTGAASVGIVL